MYISDLTPCHYHSGPFDADNWAVPLLAVGWLDLDHPYRQGQAPLKLMLRFEELREQSGRAYPQFRFRGLHNCSFCNLPDIHPPIRSSCDNVFVPGRGVVYVATGGMSHYMQAHAYMPPLAFMDAVFGCPDIASEDYRVALIHANTGEAIPLRSNEPFIARPSE
jgi:hypothetical protein